MVNESWGLEVPLNDDREGAGVRSRGALRSEYAKGVLGGNARAGSSGWGRFWVCYD